ncbi:unnamed protein product [Urochloa humidicola]
MGEQAECKISELWTPNVDDLPIFKLAKVGSPFQIKTSIIEMVQDSPFTVRRIPISICGPSYNCATISRWKGSTTISYVQDFSPTH